MLRSRHLRWLENMREGRVGGRRQHALLVQVHRSFDLDTGEAWRFAALKQACEIPLKTFVDFTAARARICAAEDAVL